MPDNGVQASDWKTSLASGESNVIKCKDGYTPTPGSQVTCTAGKTTTVGKCEAKGCQNIVPEHGVQPSNWKQTLESGTSHPVVCKDLFTAKGENRCEKGQLIQAKCETKWVHKKDTSLSKVLLRWPKDIRSHTAPTGEQLEKCAAECDKTTGCKAIVVRYDTATPKMGDAICGLALQPYEPQWLEARSNVSVYERSNTPIS